MEPHFKPKSILNDSQINNSMNAMINKEHFLNPNNEYFGLP
jgi:hypothetical protein